MDEKISLDAIAHYGGAYADKLINGFFSGKQKISGKEILSLSPIPQVNLFVIRELFKAWRMETGKQKSIYFDNDHPDVTEALSNYMGVLSNHISIDKAHFAPLLKKAVNETLLVIFDPYDFFSMLVGGDRDKLELAPFKEEIKYLKINKGPLERMLQKLEEKKVEEIPGNEAFAILDQILEEVNFTPEDLDGYIQKFSSIIPLDPSTFYSSGKPAVEKAAPKEAPAAPRKVEQSSEREGSLHDQMTKTKQSALNDNLRKIARIKDSLSINQKFMFTKVLFYGDFESFSRAVDELDQLSHMDAALNYLEGHSASWDRDSKEFHEFMEMVEKRFME
jgi:hypothetical protein